MNRKTAAGLLAVGTVLILPTAAHAGSPATASVDAPVARQQAWTLCAVVPLLCPPDDGEPTPVPTPTVAAPAPPAAEVPPATGQPPTTGQTPTSGQTPTTGQTPPTGQAPATGQPQPVRSQAGTASREPAARGGLAPTSLDGGGGPSQGSPSLAGPSIGEALRTGSGGAADYEARRVDGRTGGQLAPQLAAEGGAVVASPMPALAGGICLAVGLSVLLFSRARDRINEPVGRHIAR